MSILQATAVTKDYSGRTGVGNRVLRGVDLAVEAGQFVAVMGPSGSGKTTLSTSSPAWTGPPAEA